MKLVGVFASAVSKLFRLPTPAAVEAAAPRPTKPPELEIVALFVVHHGTAWFPIKRNRVEPLYGPPGGFPRPMTDCDQLTLWSNGVWELDSPAGRRIIADHR